MPEYPRDQVVSNDVPALAEYTAVSTKIKAGQRIKPEEFDLALADYRAQLNANWLPALNALRSSASADYEKQLQAMKQEIADIRKTVNDFKELLALLTKAAP